MKKSDSSFLERVILHNKNADERLFDLILRSVTFIVLIIIVWLYADLVHVRADGNHFSDYVFGDNNLNFSMSLNATDAFAASQNFDSVPYNSTYSSFSGYGSFDPLIISSMDLDNNYFFICKNIVSGSNELLIYFIPKDFILNGDFCLIGQTGVYVKSAFESSYYAVNSLQLNTSSSYTHYSRTVPTGYITLNSFLGAVSSNWVITFSNIPMLKGSTVNQTSADSWLASKENQLFSCFNVNYVSYDGVSNLPSIVETESNINHLYFKDVQIALSGSTNRTSLESASAVIGVDVDNWVKNNLDAFSMDVTYQWIGKYQGLSEFEYTSSYSHPCATFLNNIYSFSLAQSMIDSGFYDHAYTHMKDNYDFRSSDGVMNGLKSFSGRLIQILTLRYDGSFYTSSGGGDDNSTSILDYFYLDVSVTIHSDNVSSGVFTKRFDFLRGTESIMNSEGLRNNNPWLGEINSNDPNYVDPYSSNNGSVSSSGGNTAIATVNVYNNNNISNTITGSETQNGIDKFNDIFNTFKSSFAEMSSIGTPSNNGFMGFLSSSFNFIPGLNYIVICVGVVFSLIIILVVVRALLY